MKFYPGGNLGVGMPSGSADILGYQYNEPSVGQAEKVRREPKPKRRPCKYCGGTGEPTELGNCPGCGAGLGNEI